MPHGVEEMKRTAVWEETIFIDNLTMKEALSTVSWHGAWLDSAQTCFIENMVLL
jgi:hypothetical protein